MVENRNLWKRTFLKAAAKSSIIYEIENVFINDKTPNGNEIMYSIVQFMSSTRYLKFIQ